MDSDKDQSISPNGDQAQPGDMSQKYQSQPTASVVSHNQGQGDTVATPTIQGGGNTDEVCLGAGGSKGKPMDG